jgi:predicted negative regulator of RcsB-dependent stress response
VLLLQGQRDAAKAAYLTAFKAFDERSEYRRLVRVKLNALGVEPEAPKAAVANAASGAN